jgi:hypothetical protein
MEGGEILMPEVEQQRPRTLLIFISLTLALCIPAAVWIIDYMGKFGMLSKGLAISDEVDAELSRRGVQCTEDSTLVIPDGALNHDEFLGQNRFIASFSLLRSDGSSLAADVRLTRIQPSAPWLEGVRDGEVIRLRFQCMQQKVIWCIETDGVVRRFHGPSLRGCPASLPAPPIAARRLTPIRP